jgi:ElaB/YqjD/DUF883 family membrane-anchored ribosome-binding protein
MARSNGVTISARAFQADFEAVVPLIREEWPDVEKDALDGTGGSLDKVVALVAAKTEHTKALVKRQLSELHELSQKSEKKPMNLESALEDIEARARDLLDKIEAKGGEAAEHIKREVVPVAEEKVKENLLTSLLITLGLGFILGILFGRR